LGVEVAFDEGNAVKLSARNGDKVLLFGPAAAISGSTAAWCQHVPLLEVDDLTPSGYLMGTFIAWVLA
jgi:hypothetical protein